MLTIVPVTLPPEDDAIARANLDRWLANQDAAQTVVDLTTDRMPGYVLLTATLADDRVVTCLLDTAIRYRDAKTGKDEIWPWGWRA